MSQLAEVWQVETRWDGWWLCYQNELHHPLTQMLPTRTYGHRSCGPRKGGDVKYLASGESLLVTTEPRGELVPAAVTTASRSLQGCAIPTLFCLSVLACPLFPTYLLVVSK